MKTRGRFTGVVILGISLLLSLTIVCAQSQRGAPVMLTPSEMKWADPGAQPPGPETVVLDGNPTEAGLYTIRVRIPANHRLMPHLHPDDRAVVVISGTFHYGYGTEFDETGLRELSPGSFFTEPSNQPHFAWAKSGEVVVQATGMGPSGTTVLPVPLSGQ
jgi:quercetin dioxygenase-like cupin family protein